MYDYFLGGAHNYSVDREAADAVIAVAPEVVTAARANRAFLRRAVQYALDRGIHQFLDLGSGIPTAGNVHGIAHRTDPTAHVVYADADPVAVAHATGLLHSTPTAGMIHADIRDADEILNHPETRRLIDFDQPTALLAVSVLHFIPGDIADITAAYRERASPRSLLVISHASSTAVTSQTAEVQRLYQRTSTPIQLRTPEEILAAFTGLDLVHPDPSSAKTDDQPHLVPITEWRPDNTRTELPQHVADSPFLSGFLAGAGCKPPPASTPGPAHRRATNRAAIHNRTQRGVPERAGATR